MIVCQECHRSYRELERECPSCGSARPEPRLSERHCGPVSYVCLWIARIVIAIGVPVSLISGIVGFFHGNHWLGAGCVALAPAYWGLSAAVGLAIGLR